MIVPPEIAKERHKTMMKQLTDKKIEEQVDKLLEEYNFDTEYEDGEDIKKFLRADILELLTKSHDEIKREAYEQGVRDVVNWERAKSIMWKSKDDFIQDFLTHQSLDKGDK